MKNGREETVYAEIAIPSAISTIKLGNLAVDVVLSLNS